MSSKQKRNPVWHVDYRVSLPPPSFEDMKPARLVIPFKESLRGDKIKLELEIAKIVLISIFKNNQVETSNIRTNNPNDPPDVLFDLDGCTTGIELTELTPVNRLERDNILDVIKKSVVAKLMTLGTFKDWVIIVELDTDNATKINARGLDVLIFQALKEFFTSNNVKLDQYNRVKLPKNRGDVLLYKADLTDDPRIENSNQPLLTFLGYNTMIYPEDDIPEIVEKTLREKFSIKIDTPMWLLVWSEHLSLSSFDEKIIQSFKQFCENRTPPYKKIIYASLSSKKHYVVNVKEN